MEESSVILADTSDGQKSHMQGQNNKDNNNNLSLHGNASTLSGIDSNSGNEHKQEAEDSVSAESSSQRGVKFNPPQVIAVTANVYDKDKEACMKVGMCDFIGKPIKLQLLKAALEKCVAIKDQQEKE